MGKSDEESKDMRDLMLVARWVVAGYSHDEIVTQVMSSLNCDRIVAGELIHRYHSGELGMMLEADQLYSSEDTLYGQLVQDLKLSGIPEREAEEIALSKMAQYCLDQKYQNSLSFLTEIEEEVQAKVVFWVNNAFSSKEIIHKLGDKFGYSEEKAQKTLAAIHTQQASIKRVNQREEEVVVKKPSTRIVFGALFLVVGLILGFILLSINNVGYDYCFSIAVIGLIQLVIGLAKRKHESY
ncbi:hypothetical protein [Microscilla marina]|uniref:Uncharacterized protein n=1 Tax=Microscilla marina ATCC 23134 TaxID=313606 RepID=A1ZVV0_MICM2|nr:hypothetical protein [Microscilla marina]EAY25527.1 hypothetical protein M23134_06226 [Microscilla marina ATCC 23134]